ncbi:hypothetical protein R1flu_022485 [Riccia fluitans]|uniref:Uncharacterized protein n=1 Tax=Riccia fluitans TaxID=41844 RepID=A0ABD1XPB3_9MARC
MGDGGSEVKECWYSILGVERTASADEIRSAYRKEALKWHPDKIQQTGASPEECQRATARFQSIALAYEVLGDPTERAWYDKHRNEILSSGTASKDFDINLWSFFSSSTFSGYGETGKGFFKVYGDVFKKIHKREQDFAKAYGMGPIGESPSIGNVQSDYAEVDAFYKFWLGFATIKDFAWCDEYRISDARNRKERRLMEEENSKIRKKERREFNSAVRELASYVKKRDKRVQEKQIELQRLQAEKEQQLKLRRQQLQEEKLAKARAYKEQEWAKVLDDGLDQDDDINEDEGSYHWKNSNKFKRDSKTGDGDSESVHEFYCIVCSKRFRSEKQWDNHEKSRKHIERASALKQSLLEEDEEADALVRTQEDEAEEIIDVQGQYENTWRGEGSAASEEVPDRAFERDVRIESDPDDVKNRFPPVAEGSSLQKETLTTERRVYDEETERIFQEVSRKYRNLQIKPVVNGQAAHSAECESSSNGSFGDIQGFLESKEEVLLNGATEESDSAEDNDDEETLLAAMMSSLKNKKGVSAVPIGSSFKDNRKEDITAGEHEDEDTLSPPVAVDENLSDADDRSEEEDTKNKRKTGKSRRRSKQERLHLAAKERHDDILEELSTVIGERRGADGTGESSSIPDQPGIRVPGKEEEDWRSAPGVPGKKTKPAQTQKHAKEGLAARPGVPDSSLKVEIPQNEYSKKGVRARGKKMKTAPKPPPPNTCDTCGENFESRNQLFRHITVTSHGSMKSK